MRPPDRKALISHLPEGGRSALLVTELEGMTDCDLSDVLAELGYGLAPKTRVERAGAFSYKQATWLTAPQPSGAVHEVAHSSSRIKYFWTSGTYIIWPNG